MATQSEIAEYLDLSQASVAKLVSLEILASAGRGGLDRDACRVAYIRHLRAMAGGRMSDGDLTTQRTRVAKEQADKLSMLNALRRGEIVEIAPMVRVVSNKFASVRTQLLAVPTSVAPAAHRCKTVESTRAVIENAIIGALEAICADAEAIEAEVAKNVPTYAGESESDDDATADNDTGLETHRRRSRSADQKARKGDRNGGKAGS